MDEVYGNAFAKAGYYIFCFQTHNIQYGTGVEGHNCQRKILLNAKNQKDAINEVKAWYRENFFDCWQKPHSMCIYEVANRIDLQTQNIHEQVAKDVEREKESEVKKARRILYEQLKKEFASEG